MASSAPLRTLGRIVCAGLIALAAGSASSTPAVSMESLGSGLAVGSIEGVVTRAERPQRRVANRYPTGGSAGARTLQELPTIAYIEGPVAGAPAAPARVVQMAQQDTAFRPAFVVVPVGTTVEFPNRDPFFHNVFSFSTTESFDLGRYLRGESKSVVFDEPGVVKVYCEVHDYMRSVVIVTQSTLHAVVDAEGRFTIPNVPAGQHRLVVWNMDLSPETVTVTVPENGVARVQVTLK